MQRDQIKTILLEILVEALDSVLKQQQIGSSEQWVVSENKLGSF